MSLDDFLDIFKANLNKRNGVRYGVFTTIGESYPKSRNIVLRSFSNNTILIYTHSLSSKVEEVKNNSLSNICWYSHQEKVQLLFYGKASLSSDSVTLLHKKRVNDFKDYIGQRPGSDYLLDQNDETHFAVIEFRIDELIALKLDPEEHQKYSFSFYDDDISQKRLIP